MNCVNAIGAAGSFCFRCVARLARLLSIGPAVGGRPDGAPPAFRPRDRDREAPERPLVAEAHADAEADAGARNAVLRYAM